jgi:hypothetical protein
MVGILCNAKKERAYTKRLYALFKPLIKGKGISIMVMSLGNISIPERTAVGSIITEDKITPVKTALPSLIFNFARQRTRSDIKKMRSLMEVEGIRIVNGVNQYNQWSIMEMLISSRKTRKYVLPYIHYDKEDLYFDFTKVGNFLVKPEKGASPGRIIYGRQSDVGFDLFGEHGSMRCHRFDIQSVIHPAMRGKRWLLLKTPDLVAYRNRLFIIRACLFRTYDGEWKVLQRTIIPHGERVYDKLGRKIDAYAKRIIKCIECYIPDLGIGYVDFVLDRHGISYFLSFGGWDSKLLSKKQNRKVRIALCRNILEYAEMFSSGHLDI